MQWLFVMPLEVMAASITLEYWHLDIPGWASISIFLLIIITINLCGVKAYGEAEYGFSILKVTAVIGFIILGAVINVSLYKGYPSLYPFLQLRRSGSRDLVNTDPSHELTY